MFDIISQLGNANQNHNKISLPIHLDRYNLKKKDGQVTSVGEDTETWNICTLLYKRYSHSDSFSKA
jgi:hypothetical protein